METLAVLRRAGRQGTAGAGDVRSLPDVERLLAAAASRFGGLDILVNNAGVRRLRAVASMSTETWDKVIAPTSPACSIAPGARFRCSAPVGGWSSTSAAWPAPIRFRGRRLLCVEGRAERLQRALMQEVRHAAFASPASCQGRWPPSSWGGHPETTGSWPRRTWRASWRTWWPIRREVCRAGSRSVPRARRRRADRARDRQAP